MTTTSSPRPHEKTPDLDHYNVDGTIGFTEPFLEDGGGTDYTNADINRNPNLSQTGKDTRLDIDAFGGNEEFRIKHERARRNSRLAKLYPELPECCTSILPDEASGGKGKWMDLRNTYHLPRKLLFSCVGIVILSLGIAVCRIGDVGVDPFTAMNMGFSQSIGMNFGTFQLIVNAAILVAIFFMDKWLIGIGTIVNMVAVGYLIEFFEMPLSMLPAPDGNFLVMGVYLVVGTLLFTLGVSVYLRTSMGVSPYDAIAPAIRVKFLPKVKYVYVRIAQDVVFLILAWVAGGPLGIFTLIAAFCAGPLITMWDKVFSKPVYTKLRVLNNPEIAREFA